MFDLGTLHHERTEHEQAVGWYMKGAEAGLPKAMYNLGCHLHKGEGVAAPDHPAAADWYRRAADAGYGPAAVNLQTMYTVGRGVTRSKRLAMQCGRKAAENGDNDACFKLACCMYGDHPYARKIGHVEDAARDVMSAGVTEAGACTRSHFSST
jgi:TPR repeat protein